MIRQVLKFALRCQPISILNGTRELYIELDRLDQSKLSNRKVIWNLGKSERQHCERPLKVIQGSY